MHGAISVFPGVVSIDCYLSNSQLLQVNSFVSPASFAPHIRPESGVRASY